MRSKHLIQNILRFLGAPTAAAFVAPALAYNLHDKGGTNINLDIEALVGVVSSKERYSVDAETSLTWHEGYIKYGFSGMLRYDCQ